MGRALQGNAPQDIGTPEFAIEYYFPNPDKFFPETTPPTPAVVDHEIAEQVASVFDDVIYNETGGGNDGQIVVTVI